jgi:hypothetical protein
MDSIVNWFFSHAFTLLGGFWSVLLTVAIWWARRELKPYLKTEERRRKAMWIAQLADEITDELKARYPESKWLERLDEAVDKLIEAAGIAPEVASRAVHAAAGRKSAA